MRILLINKILQKFYRPFVIIWLLIFSLLMIGNTITLHLSTLDNKYSFYYVYSLGYFNKVNQQNIHLSEYKYVVNSIQLANNITINTNKTISTDNLMMQLTPHNKFIHLTSSTIPIAPKSISSLLICIVSMFLSVISLIITCGLLCIINMLFHIIRISIKNQIELNNHPSDKSIFSLNILLPLSAILIFIYMYLSHQIEMKLFFNSDELFLSHLFGDLNHGSHIRDWSLTQTPFFFPDYLVFALAYLISKNPYFTFLYYALFQLLYFYLLLYYLLKHFYLSRQALLVAGFTLFTSIICLVLFNPIYIFMVLSIYHFGTFLNIILLSILIINLLISRTSYNRFSLYLIFFSSVFISALSDEFIGVWFILPFLIACISHLKNKIFKEHRLLFVLFGMAIIAVLGAYSYNWLIPHLNRPNAELVNFTFAALTKRLFYLFIFIKTNFLILTAISICWIMLVLLYNKNVIKHTNDKSQLISIFNLSNIISFPLMISVIYCFPFMEYSWRYLIPMLFIPIIYLSIIIVSLANIVRWCIFIIGLFICLIFVNYQIYFAYYPDDMHCIDNALQYSSNINYGIGQYWNSNKFNLLTRSKVDIVPINGLTHQHYFFQDSIKHNYSAYDFAIVDNLQTNDKESINEHIISSPPNKLNYIVKCPQHKIYIYEPNGLILY